MLSRISSEPLMSISSKHNYKTFSESPPASFLYYIGNTLSHSSGKWRVSLTMAALRLSNGYFKFHLCRKHLVGCHQRVLKFNISLTIARRAFNRFWIALYQILS